MDSSFPHNEVVLQHIWKELLFDVRNLQTTDGKEIIILNNGIINHTDGPDFIRASLRIGEMEWHGAVEIHVRSNHWKYHSHHQDTNYDKVILHVVADKDPGPVFRKDGSSIPTLNLLPYLKPESSAFLTGLDLSRSIPCASNIYYISDEALDLQIRKAHTEYLDKKVSDLIRFYDTSLLPPKAWKHALITAVFDGFGIPHNREVMQKMAEFCIHSFEENGELLLHEIRGQAFSTDNAGGWNHKGVHPVSQPGKSLKYAVKLSEQILNTPFRELLLMKDLSIWESWIVNAKIESLYKTQILFGTVFIPSVYLLGSLFRVESLTRIARNRWNEYRVGIPHRLQDQLSIFGFHNREKHGKTLGAVHHLRAYCGSRNCHECEVLKKVISS